MLAPGNRAVGEILWSVIDFFLRAGIVLHDLCVSENIQIHAQVNLKSNCANKNLNHLNTSVYLIVLLFLVAFSILNKYMCLSLLL